MYPVPLAGYLIQWGGGGGWGGGLTRVIIRN